MIIYRLTQGGFVNDLSGKGSKLYGGRWNSAGLSAIYTTENISLAVLEILVHLKQFNTPPNYYLLSIQIPDSIKPIVINKGKLKDSWKDDISYTQFIGNEFLKSTNDLLLKVPSAIIDQGNNYIINPKHPAISKVRITTTHIFEFDKRLYLKNE